MYINENKSKKKNINILKKKINVLIFFFEEN